MSKADRNTICISIKTEKRIRNGGITTTVPNPEVAQQRPRDDLAVRAPGRGWVVNAPNPALPTRSYLAGSTGVTGAAAGSSVPPSTAGASVPPSTTVVESGLTTSAVTASGVTTFASAVPSPGAAPATPVETGADAGLRFGGGTTRTGCRLGSSISEEPSHLPVANSCASSCL